MSASISKPVFYSLILCLILVMAPHSTHLPLWVVGVSIVLILWRIYILTQEKKLPPKWLLTVMTFASAGGVFLHFHTVFGRQAGVTLLLLITVLKILETRSMRDAMVLLHLFCFLCITQFLYSQTLLTAAYTALTLMAIIISWIQVQAPGMPLKPRAKVTFTLIAQAIPLTLVLFLLFPRIHGPLWGMPNDSTARTGLSDNMAPGSLSRLIMSDEIAFRVSFQEAAPRRDLMYWRGPVLWDYDGRTWRTVGDIPKSMPRFNDLGKPSNYTVTLEPHNKTWLFALDIPVNIKAPARLTSDFRLVSKKEITSRLRYQASSRLEYRANQDESAQLLQRALQLPDNLNPQATQMALSWRQQYKQPQEIVQAGLHYFSQNAFSYTLEPPKLNQRHNIDQFLFQTRQGFCEHYASAFVFLMRTAGVPARVVTGYQGGEFNNIGQYYIVRQSDAHAWAEVWTAEQGWTRVDPTSVIAPARVRSSLSNAVENNEALPFMQRNPPDWLKSLQLNWDALANRWNQWVLGYDHERQFAVLTRMGMEVSWQKMAIYMGLLVMLLIAVLAIFMMRDLIFKQRKDPVQRAWLKLCRQLAREGLPRAEHETASDYMHRAAERWPGQRQQLQQLAQRYNQLRYSSQPDESRRSQFLQQVKAFKL